MKYKITIIIIIIVLIILGGLIGFGLWMVKGGQKVIWTTETGEERMIVIPKIPGMKFISEQKNDCSWSVDYIYEWYKNKDLSENIKDQLITLFIKQDWLLKDEGIKNGIHFANFSTEKAGMPEIIIIKLSFEEGEGTRFSLEYQWPPCSE